MQPYHNFSKGDPVDDLANCSRKLELLAQEQAIREEVPKLSKASDQAKVKGYPSNQTKGHIDNLCIFDCSQWLEIEKDLNAKLNQVSTYLNYKK